MTRHQCGEDCPTCEAAAEEQRAGGNQDLDGSMADLEADRYEKFLERTWEP